MQPINLASLHTTFVLTLRMARASNQIAERLHHNIFVYTLPLDRVMIFIVPNLAVRAKNLDFVHQTFPRSLV